ncbi:uncharacterized protein LOC116941911 isoform X1 [Petromyzon marinus]|uniref:Protein ANTAGONIST OF LIKE HETEROCHROMATIN PROTEIN 1-like isoform X3 n=1 Tax=Petromyzon marinus TaxID=7757 RepID=A0AAJ7WT23_PETMA|nr:protein ANTAGONIST OF LIKE HETEROCHROMATIN PROTEIN 1-like isoform X3 [Petromyzon marinus]XP_032809147.1 protein ANTAGONIST OF LIKE HETEROCHROMATIN PROTEIN 1-like isoform X3 [Petromyzon marinus]XP_032809148.1 protein ANTAGONIST OF LIKE HETEROCHROMATIN PROTEIN 1-like isoform X3 [Petromyzon marinus]XP_032809149.1 protein ANTAGONIST OF LIKE HETEROCHROMATIN PROTEIN 1-like isoform X3 [Petromyzon marinus]
MDHRARLLRALTAFPLEQFVTFGERLFLFLEQLLDVEEFDGWSRLRRRAVMHQYDLLRARFPMVPRTVVPVRQPRRMWMRIRTSTWWEQTSSGSDEWMKYFRVSRSMFHRIVEMVRSEMEPPAFQVRSPVPLEKRVGIALYKLASYDKYREVGNMFAVHRSTVHKYLYKFCRVMVELHLQNQIALPNEHEGRRIARGFWERFSIPQVMGMIGSTHIPITPLRGCIQDYMNRKEWPSLVLQALVDDKLRFRDISCIAPGTTQEEVVLRQSALYANSHLLPECPMEISGVEVPLQILGDAATPLLPWLLKGFSVENPTPEEAFFNKHISNARSVVDCAFGRLKARWKILLKRMEVNPTFVPHVVATCCLLHNLCEEHHEVFRQQWMEDVEEAEGELPQPESLPNRPCADEITDVRDALCRFLATSPEFTYSLHRQ